MIVGNDFERAELRARARSLDFVGDLAAAAACGEKINISISILYPLIRLRQAEKKMRDRPVRFSCCFFFSSSGRECRFSGAAYSAI